MLLAPDLGGAIAAFDWNGVAILRPAPLQAGTALTVRELACYPLVPFSNRIAAATLHCDGSAFALARYMPGHPHAIHGNGWQRRWRVAAADSTHARIELIHQPAEEAGEWPFAYRATQTFALADDVLTMRLEIENSGERGFPFGLGWHPYFPRTPDIELGFRADGVWLTDETCLPTQRGAVPRAWDFSAPRALAATTLDHCFTGWRPPAVVRWPERGLAVEIDADSACDHLVVFVPPGRDFIAVEPVTHMTDAFNRADRGEADTGTRRLAPRARFSCTMRLSVVRTH